jgi:hypothetical protein
MAGRDDSKNAFMYYKEAESKQALLPQLYEYVALSAAANGIENLSRFCLENFMKLGRMDESHKPFFCHMILSGDKFGELKKEYSTEIARYGIKCFEEEKKGRYYNSIYKHLLDVEHTFMKGLVDTGGIEKILRPQLFLFEIETDEPGACHVYVHNSRLTEAGFYPVRDGKAVVKAADGFTCRMFGAEKKGVIPGEARVRRMVANLCAGLLTRFYVKGMENPELLTSLSQYYMDQPNPPGECIEIWTKTIADPAVTMDFKMRISAALGDYYSAALDYPKSVSYYRTVDENTLDDAHIEQMLIVYINAGETEKAVSLIVRKAERISDRNLYYALKQITKVGGYNDEIAFCAYELIIKGRYDKQLIETVLRHYRGSQEEWQEFSWALGTMNAADAQLDSIILENAVRILRPDRGAQEIFARMYGFMPESPLIGMFAYYCSYEMIINGFKPEYNVVDILEELYLKNAEPVFGHALTHLYYERGTETAKTAEVIKNVIAYCERENVYYPPLEKLKDKSLLTPYIEKNRAFLHKAYPGRKVVLNYTADNTRERKFTGDMGAGIGKWRRADMKYIGFGLYNARVTCFYGEKILYRVSEEMPTGSVSGTETHLTENRVHQLKDLSGEDEFYRINEALILEQMFKYDRVEDIITDRLKEFPRVKGWIL